MSVVTVGTETPPKISDSQTLDRVAQLLLARSSDQEDSDDAEAS